VSQVQGRSEELTIIEEKRRAEKNNTKNVRRKRKIR
jgi:hypothetical protein